MAQEAELSVDSRSLLEFTKATDTLVQALKRLENASKGAEDKTDKLNAEQQKLARTLRSQEAARNKAIKLFELEEKGLDKLSKSYLEQKAAIEASEIATRKGIEAYGDEIDAIKEAIFARESAAAGVKKLAEA